MMRACLHVQVNGKLAGVKQEGVYASPSLGSQDLPAYGHRQWT